MLENLLLILLMGATIFGIICIGTGIVAPAFYYLFFV